jgi:hypothetical protein
LNQINKNQSQSPDINPFNAQCDECSKQFYDNLKDYKSFLPFDTPNLQKIFGESNKLIQTIENICPNLANIFKSDGQKLGDQFYNSGIILIGLLGFIYTTFM